MPEENPDSAACNALYAALDHWAYHVTVETTVFLDFAERATVGLTFGDHIDHDDIERRATDHTYKVDCGSARLSVYEPGASGTASVAWCEGGRGVLNPTDVRLSKGVRYR